MFKLCYFRLINEGSVVKVEAFGTRSFSLKFAVSCKAKLAQTKFQISLNRTDIPRHTNYHADCKEGGIYKANYLEFTFPY